MWGENDTLAITLMVQVKGNKFMVPTRNQSNSIVRETDQLIETKSTLSFIANST